MSAQGFARRPRAGDAGTFQMQINFCVDCFISGTDPILRSVINMRRGGGDFAILFVLRERLLLAYLFAASS